MGIENFIEDLKAKSINPLLKDQAVKYTEAALTRYQDDIGRELTPDELQFAASKLTPDRINSGAYAKKAIADAIQSIPIAGKTIAAGLKSAAEIPALMLEAPKALYGASKAIPSPAELMMDTFAGRERVKRELDPVSQGLAQTGQFIQDLASDVTGIQEGQGFQDLPTGLGTVVGLLGGGSIYAKAFGAASEGALAANIFKDLTAKGIAGTAAREATKKVIAQAGTKRFIAGAAANTIAGSPLSLSASMDEEGNINLKDLALNLAIDTTFGGAIEGIGAALTKNYGKQALREAGRMAQGQEGFIFRGNSKESLKGIAETKRAFNRRNVEAYKAKGANEARAAEEAKAAAALKYEKIESDLMQARSLTEQRQGQLAEEQTRLGLKEETRQNVSTLNEMYEAEKQTAFKQIDTEQDKLVSEIQRESEQKTKNLLKQKADIDKQERTLTKPFDLEEKNLAKQQKQVNDSYQRAKKQAETEPVEITETPETVSQETATAPQRNYEEEFNLFQKETNTKYESLKTQLEESRQTKIAELDIKFKQKQESYAREIEQTKAEYSKSLDEINNLPDSVSKEKKAKRVKQYFENRLQSLERNNQKLEGQYSQAVKQTEEQVASKLTASQADFEKSLKAKQTELAEQQLNKLDPTYKISFNKFQKDLSSEVKTKVENIKVFITKKIDALKLELQKLEEASEEADIAYNKIKRDFLQEGALEKFDETEKIITATKKRLDASKKLYAQKLKEINETANRQIEVVKTKAEQQLKAQEDKVNALKQKRRDKRSKSGESLTQEELNAIPSIKTANIALGKYKYQVKEATQKKIANIKSFAKEKIGKLESGLKEEKANLESLLQQKESLKPILDNPSLKKAEEQRNKIQEQLNKFKNKTYPEKLKKLQETVAKQIETVKTKQQQALEAKQAEINQLKADVETKRLQDIELQKQQLKEQRLKALDDEYNAARSDVDTRLSVTNANRNQAVSDFQAKKQALLEQQQKLEQEVKDKIDYLNRRREALKKQKEVALNRQFKKDALREYREKMGIETPVLRNADDIEIDRMIAKEELDQIDSQLAKLKAERNPIIETEEKTISRAELEKEALNDMYKAMYRHPALIAKMKSEVGKAEVENTGAFISDASVEMPTATKKPKNKIIQTAENAGNLWNTLVQPIISALRDINPSLAGQLRKFEFASSKIANKHLSQAMPLFSKLGKLLSKNEKKIFNSYLIKGDHDAIMAFLSKIDKEGRQFKELPPIFKVPLKFLEAEDTARDFEKLINKPLTELYETGVRPVLDDLYAQQTEAGLEVGFIENYFPTSVKKDSVETWRSLFDLDKITDDLKADPATRTEYDTALAKERKKLGRELEELERIEFTNKFLRGYGGVGSTPTLSNRKPRSGLAQQMEGIIFKDAKGNERFLSDLYEDPATVLENYINRSTFDIESRKFFGRADGADLTTSVGAFTDSLRQNNEISSEQVVKVKDLLTARFVNGPKKPANFARLAKDGALLTALNDIQSTITQATELGTSAYRNGILNTIKGLGQSFDPETVKTLDLGIARIGADYADNPSVVRKVVDFALKINGFRAANKLMQETQLNAGFNYFKNVFTKEKGAKFDKEYSYLKSMFGVDEADRMVQAFRTKDLKEAYDDDSIGLALFERLSGTQVLSLSDMPAGYLQAPDLRFFYALKSFSLKMLQFTKDEVYSGMANGIKSIATKGLNKQNTKQLGESLRNAIALSVLVGGSNYGINYFKDIIKGKTSEEYQSLEERAVEAAFQTFIPIVNPYMFYKLDKQGLAAGFGSFIMPAAPWLDALDADVKEYRKAVDTGEEYNPFLSRILVNNIPIAGKTLYAWSPAGRKQYENAIEAKQKDRAAKEKKLREKQLAELRGY